MNIKRYVENTYILSVQAGKIKFRDLLSYDSSNSPYKGDKLNNKGLMNLLNYDIAQYRYYGKRAAYSNLFYLLKKKKRFKVRITKKSKTTTIKVLEETENKIKKLITETTTEKILKEYWKTI